MNRGKFIFYMLDQRISLPPELRKGADNANA